MAKITRMPNVIYEMSVSADGYIVGPDGTFDWAMPDEELHRFHNQQARGLAGHLLGRRLYETMRYWDTAEDDPSDITREFAVIWQALPKVVFSRTLEAVEGANTTLARRDLGAELASLQESGNRHTIIMHEMIAVLMMSLSKNELVSSKHNQLDYS